MRRAGKFPYWSRGIARSLPFAFFRRRASWIAGRRERLRQRSRQKLWSKLPHFAHQTFGVDRQASREHKDRAKTRLPLASLQQ